MKKTDFCLWENKGANQLHSYCEADQCLCFRYMDSTISLLPKSEISSFLPSSESVQASLCRTRSETPKNGFLALPLIWLKKQKKKKNTKGRLSHHNSNGECGLVVEHQTLFLTVLGCVLCQDSLTADSTG